MTVVEAWDKSAGFIPNEGDHLVDLVVDLGLHGLSAFGGAFVLVSGGRVLRLLLRLADWLANPVGAQDTLLRAVPGEGLVT